ncbi:hypothetical protein [Qipengyuania sp. S6317L1]|nr:hypothetical protein [Qipengyuania sp. S6317L1]
MMGTPTNGGKAAAGTTVRPQRGQLACPSSEDRLPGWASGKL